MAASKCWGDPIPEIRRAVLHTPFGFMYEFPYYITDQGDVYNRYMKKLKPWLRGTRTTRYRTIRMCGKHVSINLVVASTFCPRQFNKERNEVGHINGNSLDDRAVNLRWVTRSENEKHKHKLRRKEETALEIK